MEHIECDFREIAVSLMNLNGDDKYSCVKKHRQLLIAIFNGSCEDSELHAMPNLALINCMDAEVFVI